jgi:hypothetical protein
MNGFASAVTAPETGTKNGFVKETPVIGAIFDETA